MQRERYLTGAHLLGLAKWKSPRRAGDCELNSEEFVQAVTRVAATADEERLRVEVLRLLHGVDWRTASVVLHVGSRDAYPILDRRALWSLQCPDVATVRFDFWWAYVEHTRQLARSAAVDMRTLDRALWQYSKVNE